MKEDEGVGHGGLVFLQTTGAVASAAAGGINWSHGRSSWIILAIAALIFMVGAATSGWGAYWQGRRDQQIRDRAALHKRQVDRFEQEIQRLFDEET